MIYYYSYLFFIRHVYGKKWKGYHSSANGLSFACLMFIAIFAFTFIDFVANGHFSHLLGRYKLPFGPIAGLVYMFIHVMVSFLFRTFGHRTTISKLKAAINYANRLPRWTSIAYVTASSLLFIASLGLVILSVASFPIAPASLPAQP